MEQVQELLVTEMCLKLNDITVKMYAKLSSKEADTQVYIVLQANGAEKCMIILLTTC